MWDRGVRVAHWCLVVSVIAAAYTGFILGRNILSWHLAAGVTALGITTWRIIWGGLGSGYARFASFAYRPAIILEHVRGLVGKADHRHIGHNPLGSVMVFGFFAIVPAIALCGVMALGGMLKQGPLKSFLSYDVGIATLRLHKWLAIAMMAMIAGHLMGVFFESWRGRENLVGAMIYGDKRIDATSVLAASAAARPGPAFFLMTCVLAGAAISTVALDRLPGWGMPPPDTNAVFAEQCGACHVAFPASLAPASTWDQILAHLQHHFGADATLAPEQITEIRMWLDTNAAEHWDSLPSHLLRRPAPDGSLRITDTPGWRGRHREISATTFAANPIYRRSNCAACHADVSTGWFAPQNIAVPKIARPAQPG